MPYYNLKRMSDLEVLSAVCLNHAAALVEFGEELGVTLTLEECPSGVEYMMGYRDDPSAAWIRTDIPVYIDRS